jgi:tetratricopeptide (TPR) repeat protein
MENETTKKAEPLDYDRLLAQIKESGQPIEEATTILTAAVSSCIKQRWSEEIAQQYNEDFNALLQRHIRVEEMDVDKRLEVWSMNGRHNEASARRIWFNLDYAIDHAEMKVREASAAYDKALAAYEATRSWKNGVGELLDATRRQFHEALNGYSKAVEAYLDVRLDFPDFLSLYEHLFLEEKHLILPAEFKRKFSDLFDEAHHALVYGEDSDQLKQAEKAVEDFLQEHGIPAAEAKG